MYIPLEENIPFLTQTELEDDNLFKVMPEFTEFWNSEEGKKARLDFSNILEKLYLESNIEPYIDIDMVKNIKAQYEQAGTPNNGVVDYILYFIKFKDYIDNRKIYMQAFLSYSKFYDEEDSKINALEELKNTLIKNVSEKSFGGDSKIVEFYIKWKQDMILEIVEGTKNYILGKDVIYKE